MISKKQKKFAILLASFHIAVIAASNYLVQIPVSFAGLHSTWGSFTFPFIFLATDLTVRIFGAHLGRRIIFLAMLPALLISYFISVVFKDGSWQGFAPLLQWDWFVARIALASFAAYGVGQMMDIFVFNKLRQKKSWWQAPTASAFIGNLLDTITFFTVAFYNTPDPYLSEHLSEIASLDYSFKLTVNIIFFLPLYKILLNWILNFLEKRTWQLN
ncbi:7-cyano-7-deazaguanine/7-aminomethyl-7-deazaguanine transporter [Elizabethkingia sp. JS20170427COW]|uniref:7-cyano-7-deazaguanine/7-aminomethyl-7- deazaguanine transporter n=1 Tax=Elizabethkingia sp. JS20170427COW TaxID=2583851 RepID=UPI001110852E|nr:7-cyano-7-deazaguanine/7-aminomethyl-7-deazaguanine transporter [Elizabethkingia sp. JS20170427COW]QCX53952.1 7-cyano-7-deazaguanine/7-aminomethyl-7-deazaguanine transporter [Elizabethkingia sp. JS20170427COW]